MATFVELCFSDFEFDLRFAYSGVYLFLYGLIVFVVVDVKIDFVLFEFVFKLEILLCGFGLTAQRIDLLLYLVDDLICDFEIGGGFFKFAFRFGTLRAELGYSRRFFEYLTAIAGFCRHNLGNPALSDDRIAFLAYAGVVEKRNNVAHTHAIVVYVIFGKSASVKFSCDDHFFKRHRGKNVLTAVVEGERNFAI